MSFKLEALQCPGCGSPLEPRRSSTIECDACGNRFLVLNNERGVNIIPVIPEKILLFPENGFSQPIITTRLWRGNDYFVSVSPKEHFFWNTYTDGTTTYIEAEEALKQRGWHLEKQGQYYLLAHHLLYKKNQISDDPRDYGGNIRSMCDPESSLTFPNIFALVNPCESPDSVFNPDMYYYDNLVDKPSDTELSAPRKKFRLFDKKPAGFYGLPSYLAPVTYTCRCDQEKQIVIESLSYSYLGFPGSKPDVHYISRQWQIMTRTTPINQ